MTTRSLIEALEALIEPEVDSPLTSNSWKNHNYTVRKCIEVVQNHMDGAREEIQGNAKNHIPHKMGGSVPTEPPIHPSSQATICRYCGGPIPNHYRDCQAPQTNPPPDATCEISVVQYACSFEGDDIYGLFLADENGSHCGKRIAQIKGHKSMEEILDRLNMPYPQPEPVIGHQFLGAASAPVINEICAKPEQPVSTFNPGGIRGGDAGHPLPKLIEQPVQELINASLFISLENLKTDFPSHKPGHASMVMVNNSAVDACIKIVKEHIEAQNVRPMREISKARTLDKDSTLFHELASEGVMIGSEVVIRVDDAWDILQPHLYATTEIEGQ